MAPYNLSYAEAKKSTLKQNDMHLDTKEAAMRFSEFDTNGDQELDFEEFYAMQPQRLREQFSVEEIRKWFDAADADHNNVLSINEFFLWTISSVRHAKLTRARPLPGWDARLHLGQGRDPLNLRISHHGRWPIATARSRSRAPSPSTTTTARASSTP